MMGSETCCPALAHNTARFLVSKALGARASSACPLSGTAPAFNRIHAMTSRSDRCCLDGEDVVGEGQQVDQLVFDEAYDPQGL